MFFLKKNQKLVILKIEKQVKIKCILRFNVPNLVGLAF